MAVRARKAALTQFGGLFLSAQKSLPHSLACPHLLGAAQEHPNSIRRCFKHGCAGRILHSGRTEGGPLRLYIGPTPIDAVCPRGTYGDNAKPLAARSADGFAV